MEHRLRYHPYKIFVYGLTAGLIFMFLSLAVSFLYTDFQSSFPQVRIPVVFHLSTFAILISSVFLKIAEKAVKKEEAMRVRNYTIYVFVAGILFLTLQYYGWLQFVNEGITMRGSQSGSFFFLLSGLHAFHIMLGLFFILLMIARIHKTTLDNISHLIYFSDPVRKMNFNLTAFYWHIVGGIWIFLYLIFMLVLVL